MTFKKLRLLLFFCLAPAAWAGYGAGDSHLEKLFSTFISPCCWRENLTVHDSETAQELRTRIESMVREGRTDDDIKATLVKEYTAQILALPEGDLGEWLFITPFAAALVGTLGIVLLLRRLRSRTSGSVLAEISPAWIDDDWDRE